MVKKRWFGESGVKKSMVFPTISTGYAARLKFCLKVTRGIVQILFHTFPLSKVLFHFLRYFKVFHYTLRVFSLYTHFSLECVVYQPMILCILVSLITTLWISTLLYSRSRATIFLLLTLYTLSSHTRSSSNKKLLYVYLVFFNSLRVGTYNSFG